MPRVDTGKGKGKGEGARRGYRGPRPKKDFLSFEEARAIVRTIKLGSAKEWEAWSKAGRPSNIPSTPNVMYRDDGWISMPDWLGKDGGRGAMLHFSAARTIVLKLKLGSQKEWNVWSKSEQRPSNIPSHPYEVYRDDGWISMPDWLGYEGRRAPPGSMLSFMAARAIVRKLKLKSSKEWVDWRSSGQRPSNIPSTPSKMYRDDGWISMPDWLGYEGLARGKMLPFPVARMIVRKLKLKGLKEWEAWKKAGQRPSNIPSTPSQVYRDAGWISMPDWLGYGSEGGTSGSSSASSSSSSSSSSSTTQKKTNKKTKKTKKTVAPPRGNTNGGPSRKRARAPSGSDSDSDDDTLGGSSGPPQT